MPKEISELSSPLMMENPVELLSDREFITREPRKMARAESPSEYRASWFMVTDYNNCHLSWGDTANKARREKNKVIQVSNIEKKDGGTDGMFYGRTQRGWSKTPGEALTYISITGTWVKRGKWSKFSSFVRGKSKETEVTIHVVGIDSNEQEKWFNGLNSMIRECKGGGGGGRKRRKRTKKRRTKKRITKKRITKKIKTRKRTKK